MGKVEVIRLIIVVKNKNCQAYLVCSLFFHPLRCPVDLASSSSWLAMLLVGPAKMRMMLNRQDSGEDGKTENTQGRPDSSYSLQR